MYKAVVFDVIGINYLQRSGNIQDDWLDHLSIPSDTTDLSLRVVEGIAYVLSNRASKDSPLVIIPTEVFGDASEKGRSIRADVFERIIRASLSMHEATVHIPVSWRPYSKGDRLSFQSNRYSSGISDRVYLCKRAKGTAHTFVYFKGISQKDLSLIAPDWKIFDSATRNFIAALDTAPAEATDRGHDNRLELRDVIKSRMSRGKTVHQWYETELTKDQLDFVDLSTDRPIRLIGSAGTGKTLAMVIKCLLTLYSAIDNEQEIRVVFLTHSMASREAVWSWCLELDERGYCYSEAQKASFDVTTLQQLANEAMGYDLAELEPLSDDGHEGRQMQLELIDSLLKNLLETDWIAYAENCSEKFRSSLEAKSSTTEHRLFQWELMNEFACVLDASGVGGRRTKRQDYLKLKRRKWMMPLHTEDERSVVYHLYEKFRDELSSMGVIGVDQMISDYLGYLDSFRWNAIRMKDGYDVVFVDELHLFNRQERMLFQFLLRDLSRGPSVIMAYDSKQSPRDTFVEVTERDDGPSNIWQSAGLTGSEKIELLEVFRYTPEIAEFLSYVDQNFPAVDFEEDWPAFKGVSKLDSGPVPIWVDMSKTVLLHQAACRRAERWAKKIGRGRDVAVLCLSDELFEAHLHAGEFAKKRVNVTSREDLTQIRYCGKRFVFSKPEYVAGLQFQVVLLIEVNKDELPIDESEVGAKRRFVSKLYLGASRAERILEIFSNQERGGLSDVLAVARDMEVMRCIEASAIDGLRLE